VLFWAWIVAIEQEVTMARQRRTTTPQEAAHKRTLKKRAQTARKQAAAKKFPLCACGCKERTRGGKYRPGHDARHHAQLRKAGKDVEHVMSAKQRKQSRDAQADARAKRKAEAEATVARMQQENGQRKQVRSSGGDSK
jgi:hypothetical protein